MSLQQLFDHLDDLVRTPEDVARLEAAILDLAVRGKLVRQEEGDEPAEELLQRIRTTKAQHGEITSSEQVTEAPFSIPPLWSWCRWIDVSAVITDVDHKMPAEQPAGVPYVSPRDFTADGRIDFANAKKIAYETFLVLAEKVKPERGDIIFPRYGTIGVNRLVDTDIDFLASYSCAVVKHMRGFMDPRYVYYYSLSGLVKYEIGRYINKTTQPNVGIRSIQQFLFPLPPLPEQRRIVAKVDELLAQTRALAANLRRAQGEIVTANEAALHRLESAEDGASLQRAWHTLAGSFDLLYDDPRPLAALRQAILQLAVRGKLVLQEEGDEPVLPSIAEATGPYALPASWKWAEIDAICSHVVDCPHSTAKFINEGSYYCLDTTCIDQGVILYDRIRRVSEATFNERIKRLRPKSGDILFSREGSIGLTVIVPDEMNVCLGQRMMLFRPSQLVTSEYLRYALISDMFVQQWHTQRTGTAAQHVNVGTLRRAIIPLPPLAEQRRIVAKVDELLAMCDALEGRLGQAAAAQRAALEAVLAHI